MERLGEVMEIRSYGQCKHVFNKADILDMGFWDLFLFKGYERNQFFVQQ